MHALRAAGPAQHSTNALNVGKPAGPIAQGDRANPVSGSACFLLFLALRLAVSSKTRRPFRPTSNPRALLAEPSSQAVSRSVGQFW
jgi:hypothetical protein